MGLAGKKEKTKVGLDPRNTYWVKDTSRFGHKYLSNLGWTPGETLGDTTSSYHSSGHITDASTVGVKIFAKGDNLGIGAKLGVQDECTGLLGLHGLLGRLNGDDEAMNRVALEEDRRAKEYITGKWGMKFVKGEVWQADDFAALLQKKTVIKEGGEVEGDDAEKKKGGKRKRGGGKEKKSKKPKREKSASGAASETEPDQPTVQKSKKKASKRGNLAVSSDEETEPNEPSKRRSKSKSRTASEEEGKSNDEEERRCRKEKRRQRKENKKTKKAKKDKVQSSKRSSESESENATTASSTPAPPKTRVLVGRQAVRARFIAAKKSAVMDSKSLNEIFMIKA